MWNLKARFFSVLHHSLHLLHHTHTQNLRTYKHFRTPHLFHTYIPQVRDLLTTTHEQSLLSQGLTGGISASLRTKDMARVDAVISTIGFPLVGGPAGR